MVTDSAVPGGRGQAHTLEAVVASLVLLSSIVFALQMTAVTPLSASTSSQHLENQQNEIARGVLAAAAEHGALKRTLLTWNDSAGRFFNASDLGYYTNRVPPTEFGAMLNRSFDRRGLAYNVYLRYRTAGGDSVSRRLVYQGVPSDNAVRTAYPVTVFQNDQLHDHRGDPTGTPVNETSTFYAANVDDSSVYNVVRVEVVTWRI